jgi:hypothetical protein
MLHGSSVSFFKMHNNSRRGELVDGFQRAFYEQGLELAFLKRTESAFQDLFSEIMEKRYPSDFQRVRPWGNVGDRKNDGYLRSERRLFQVYAPKTIILRRTLAKISADFKGAFPYWKEHFDHWTYVHNDRDGLAPDILKLILELERGHEPVRCAIWGFEEIRQIFFEINSDSIASILGPAPTDRDIQNVRFDDLKLVLDNISSRRAVEGPDLRPVPSDKLRANGLSESVEMLLTAGMKKADLVGTFFSQWYDPTYGDSIAEAFRQKYAQLRAANYLPDDIFRELWSFAGGAEKGLPEHEASVLAVLAHLFEQCDIFERSRDDSSGIAQSATDTPATSAPREPLSQLPSAPNKA